MSPISPTIYGDALIECGVAVFDQLKHKSDARDTYGGPGE
jgi:hypothetical protein